MEQSTKPATRLLFLSALAISFALLAVGFHKALYVAPTEATMGNIQRIFYWHVPSNILALSFPYVNLLASLAYLYYRRRNPLAALTADALALASAEITLVFATIGIITGMLWGRPVWGIWWTWDARLTTFLLLWLLFAAYLLTRRLAVAGQTPTLAAVISIFAAVDVPIVWKSIEWWRTQHPAPVLRGGGQIDPVMKHIFYFNLLAWTLWGILLCTFRFALERRRQRAEQAATLRALEAGIYPTDLTYPHQSEPNNAF